MYKVNADYRQWNKGKNWYYVVANSIKEAKKKFKDRITWLDIYIIEEIKDNNLIEEILSNHYKYICIK